MATFLGSSVMAGTVYRRALSLKAMTGDIVNARAPAKLNLALAVGPPLPDGMHPICSWMVTVDLFDELEVKRLESDRFSRYAILWHADARRRSDIDWSITRDLAVRAHLALEEHVGRRLPVQLKLEKRIPVAAGLGGGSSNAAAMLHALDHLFELDLGGDALATLGAELGADVSFLVHGGSAIVEGTGDRVHRHDAVPELHFVVVLPDAACPTGHVYARFDEIGPGPLQPDAVHALAGTQPLRPDALFNDLTRAAVRVAPALEDLLAQVGALAERPAHVSGSGAGVFVLCDDELHADFLAAAIERAHDVPAIAARTTEGVVAARDEDLRPAAPIE
jgi:4-diphosphocytidyl-2-C-methyl-D-erythritol kinase